MTKGLEETRQDQLMQWMGLTTSSSIRIIVRHHNKGGNKPLANTLSQSSFFWLVLQGKGGRMVPQFIKHVSGE